MEYLTYSVWIVISIALLLFLFGFYGASKEKQNILNRTFYLPLGFLSTIFLTPLISYLLTINVTSFEGARGYAFMYSLPVSFICLLILWSIIHKTLSKKKNYYVIATKIFTLIEILALWTYLYSDSKRKQEFQFRKQNVPSCKKLYEDSYTGIVIDTSRGNLKVRKMDSTYKEFKYYYHDKNFIRKNCYIGQKITKLPNSEVVKITLRNNEVKELTLPCYQAK